MENRNNSGIAIEIWVNCVITLVITERVRIMLHMFINKRVIKLWLLLLCSQTPPTEKILLYLCSVQAEKLIQGAYSYEWNWLILSEQGDRGGFIRDIGQSTNNARTRTFW